MAVTMSNATIDNTERESFLNSEVDTSVTAGGAQLNTVTNREGGIFGLFGRDVTSTTGAKLAGVTPQFAQHVKSAIDDYISSIDYWLNQIQDTNSNVAFKGEAISAALSSFVSSIREVANSFTNKLKIAEQQIIDSVDLAYKTQDEHVSGEMNTDSSNVSGTAIN